MDEYFELGGKRYCERHVADAVSLVGHGSLNVRAERRRTRLVDVPRGTYA